MQQLRDQALALTARPHGEHGAVVRFLTFGHGLQAGYVPGARGKGRRALLHPGNRVDLSLRARAEGQLAGATVELVESRALLAFEPGTAALLAYLTELTAAALAEGVPHPRLATALDALLAGLGAGVAGVAAASALARYELLLLEEEGFGLDLASCALGGPVADLGFVSPKTGRAVSRGKALGQAWAAQLLPLPGFLLTAGGAPTPDEASAALALAAHFLARHWLAGEPLVGLRRRAIHSIMPAATPSPLAGAAPDPKSL
jgi:DNA repair protein RecO (recombination protein O)